MDEHIPFSNMYLVSALLAYGYQITRIDKSNPRRQKFFFNVEETRDIVVVDGQSYAYKTSTVEDVEAHFFSRTLMLPGRYVDFLSDVRSTIHSHLEESRTDGR